MNSLTCRCCLAENINGYNLFDYSEHNNDVNLPDCCKAKDDYCSNVNKPMGNNSEPIRIDPPHHDDNCNSGNVKLTYTELFTICTNIKSDENAKYSTFICFDCCEELNNAYKFRRKCEISSYILSLRTPHDIHQTNDIITIEEKPILIESLIDYLTEEKETIELIQQQTDDNEQHNEPPLVIEILPKIQQIHKFRNDELLTEQEPMRIQEIEVSSGPSKSYVIQHRVKYSLQDHDYSNHTEDVEVLFGEQTESTTEEINMKPNNKLKQLNLINNKDEKTSMTIKRFNCEQCGEIFPLLSMMTKHIEKMHKVQQRFLCNVCGKLCLKESTLRAHLISHRAVRAFKCNECDKSYFTKYTLNMHKSAVHDKNLSDLKYICSICGKGFLTNARLKLHILIHSKRNFECEFCQKLFITEYRLRGHMRAHTGERPYKCDECGLTFTQSGSLKSHQRIHTGERPYACTFCNKRFTQHSILTTHLALHTGKAVKCPDCNKMFSRSSQLISHRREHTGEKPYICGRCPNRYKQKSHLTNHMDTHLGIKHTCDICNKNYSKQWSLKVHMYTHSNERPFSCEMCAMTFVRRDRYQKHLKQHDHPTKFVKKQTKNTSNKTNTSGKKTTIKSIEKET